jgi:hypothetical protein
MKDFAANAANKSEYYRDHTIMVDCVELHLKNATGANQPLYLCSGGADLTFDTATAPTPGANTYLSQGNFIGFTSLAEDFDVKVGKFSIYLSGINNTFINSLVNTEVEGKRVVIYKAFLGFGPTGQDPLSLVADPILMFDGIIYNFAVTESSKSCQITIDCSSLFADFERTNGRKTNNWSNWLFQGANADTCFEKSGLVGKTEFKWGRN